MSPSREEIWSEACAMALAGLPAMGPQRLSVLLAEMTPASAWKFLVDEVEWTEALLATFKNETQLHEVREAWFARVRRTDPLEVFGAYKQLGIEAWTRHSAYPARLMHDEHAPAVLFAQGEKSALDRSTVAIIGTRRCSYEGRSVARKFGRELSEAGLSVVSGLALGIDGAAHTGALEASFGAPPIAVVGNGLDSIYPKRHAELWRNVRKAGLIIAESPLGAGPDAWRFPARNRILAGLADLLLVVESHERGGSLITVQEAASRGVPVMAVPGSVQKPASAGSNRLFFDGAMPALSTDDVLMALSHESHVSGRTDPVEMPRIDNELDASVLAAIDWEVTSTDEVMLRTGRSLGEVAVSIARLAQQGWVVGSSGWWQRTSPQWS